MVFVVVGVVIMAVLVPAALLWVYATVRTRRIRLRHDPELLRARERVADETRAIQATAARLQADLDLIAGRRGGGR